MDIERAKELLEILADGVNPLTGEILTADDSCNQVEIVRALNTVLRQLDNGKTKTEKTQPVNAGKPWTQEDDNALRDMFDSGVSRKEMCHHFGRSCGAITSRLVLLGCIE